MWSLLGWHCLRRQWNSILWQVQCSRSSKLSRHRVHTGGCMVYSLTSSFLCTGQLMALIIVGFVMLASQVQTRRSFNANFVPMLEEFIKWLRNQGSGRIFCAHFGFQKFMRQTLRSIRLHLMFHQLTWTSLLSIKSDIDSNAGFVPAKELAFNAALVGALLLHILGVL